MKLGNVENIGENTQTVIIPRDDNNVVFKLRAVKNSDDFDKICTEPEAPCRQKPGGARIPNLDDPSYKKKLEEHNTKRFDWMMLESLKATEDLEWSTVKMHDPDTYENWRTELEAFGLNLAEVSHVIQGMMRANSLDEAYLEEARKTFLATSPEV